jgi:DNA-binding MarR family transcriptional regulator
MRQRNKNILSLAGAHEASFGWEQTGALDSTAAAVIEVIPAVMDTMRTSLRSHVGDQLTVPQFRCLAFISRHGGTTVTEVSSFMGVTKATASVMIDRLMRAGSVLVVSDAADRRRSLLHISSSGRTQMQSIRNEARKDFAQAMSSLSKQELDTLTAGLEILRKTFRRERLPVRDMSVTT